MPDFDVEAFVSTLDRLGMKLTTVPLADGKLRVNRWRMMHAAEHAQQIQDLWTMQIGNDQRRIDALAAHLSKVAPRKSVDFMNSVRPQAPLQTAMAPQAAMRPNALVDPTKMAASPSKGPPEGAPARGRG